MSGDDPTYVCPGRKTLQRLRFRIAAAFLLALVVSGLKNECTYVGLYLSILLSMVILLPFWVLVFGCVGADQVGLAV